MKKQLIVQATLCALALSSSSVFAGPLTVPNTFTSGEPALAARCPVPVSGRSLQ